MTARLGFSFFLNNWKRHEKIFFFKYGTNCWTVVRQSKKMERERRKQQTGDAVSGVFDGQAVWWTVKVKQCNSNQRKGNEGEFEDIQLVMTLLGL